MYKYLRNRPSLRAAEERFRSSGSTLSLEGKILDFKMHKEKSNIFEVQGAEARYEIIFKTFFFWGGGLISLIWWGKR